MRIALLVPSRGRPTGLVRMWASALATAARPEAVELVVRLDDDDPRLPNYRAAGLAGNVSKLVGPRTVLSECWNEAWEVADFGGADLFMLCADDVRFRTRRWDDQVREAVEQYADGLCLVYGRDGLHDEELATHPVVTRQWTDLLGYFVPPLYVSDFNDAHLMELATAVDRAVYLPEWFVEHLHPAAAKAAIDRTHRERLARHEAERPDLLYASQAPNRLADAERLRQAISAAQADSLHDRRSR